MAFLFIDRITEFVSGRMARGVFRVPAAAPEWPAFLLAEAVGQLAGWAAMAEVDFQRRPVAALAGEVLIVGEATPGEEIELAVQLDRFERGAVLYGGSASSAGGETLLAMSRCVGPMLPMEDFDDPAAVRARLERLRSGDPSSYVPIEPLHADVVEIEPGVRLRAAMDVPAAAALFAEHFPRRPVYPATLLLDRHIEVARRLLPEPSRWFPRRALHVKIGAFVHPGDRLEVQANVASAADELAVIAIAGLRDGSRVSRVRVEYARRGD